MRLPNKDGAFGGSFARTKRVRANCAKIKHYEYKNGAVTGSLALTNCLEGNHA